MMTKKKQKVAVLFGGRSAERDISIRTGTQILAHIDRTKYTPIPIEIPQQGTAWVKKLLRAKPDAAFVALHGPYGEDGTMQGMLEMLNIPYTGSGVLASALAMDKYRLQQFVKGQGIVVPRSVLVSRKEFFGVRLKGRQYPSYRLDSIISSIAFPCVVKPNQLGSSVGVTVNVRSNEALQKALKIAFNFDTEVLIEEFIRGREITAPVIGNEHPKALPLIEIIPKSGVFYDYKSKYANGGSDHIIPAPLSIAATKKIQAIALHVHALIGAMGVTRCDFILKGSTPYFLEINTSPGMTSTSLVPQSAEHAGISFKELLDRLIVLARKK